MSHLGPLGWHHVDGLDYFQEVWPKHDECQRETDFFIGAAGNAPPQYCRKECLRVLQALGTALARLQDLFHGRWGSSNIPVLRELVGRCVGNGDGAMRLIRFGLYDEAIVLARNIAEIGNLLQFFTAIPGGLDEWMAAPPGKRKREFSASAVAKRLGDAGEIISFDATQFGSLSELAVHPTPDTRPQNYNAFEITGTGGVFSAWGVQVALYSLALAVAHVLRHAAALFNQESALTDARMQALTTAVAELLAACESLPHPDIPTTHQ